MSRKQRAAKLLNGHIGLTGLDALTEGEGSFEEALLEAIGRDEALLDPAALFRTNAITSQIQAEDSAYWHHEAHVAPIERELEPSSEARSNLPAVRPDVAIAAADIPKVAPVGQVVVANPKRKPKVKMSDAPKRDLSPLDILAGRTTTPLPPESVAIRAASDPLVQLTLF